MILQHELRRNGPYLSVVVPEVDTDWDALWRDISPELDEGVTRVTVLAPFPADPEDERGLRMILRKLAASGVDAFVERR